MSRGIFRLKQVYEEQLSGQWSTRGDVWLTPSPFMGPSSLQMGFANGYFSGGYQPANSPSFPSSVYYSTVSRIDYSNDTTTVPARGSLNDERYSHSGTGNQNFGYHGGGSPYVGGGSGEYRTDVERIDYSNDTATASVRGPLVFGFYLRAATGNASFGYFAGGVGIPPGERSSVDRIDYSNDSATSVEKGPLNTARMQVAATGNQDFGYVGGGSPQQTNAPVSTVDRIDYSNDTATASPKGPFSVVRRETGATGNASFGYFGGGYNTVPGGNNWLSSIERIDYSNDTATASPKGPLSRTRGRGCATGDQSFGYFGGSEGNNNENLSVLDRLDYSNDTATTVDKGPLSHSLRTSAASSSKQNANPVQTLQPASSPRPNITSAGTDFGYFGAGSYPSVSSYKSTVDRIDFNNDTATASPKGNLSRTTQNHGGASSNTGGYFFGRFPAVSTVDRIDYLNDTATASPKGNLSVAGGYLASTGNNDFGYTGGRYPSGSTIDRLDYSNDTANAVAKGPLSLARWALAATGNQSFGYFMGGVTPAAKTTVDRVDYSNDTPTASPKGPLNTTNGYNATATGNANFGYVTVGTSAGASSISRIDYSNDTATAAPKGPLISARSYRGATGNSNFGYFSGGQLSYTTVHSDISRIDYSNDTATALSKGNLSIAKNKHAGVSSRQAALPAIGPGIVEVPVAFGNFSAPGPVPVESSNFGYFVGGSPGALSTVDRVDYSNDTATAATKGPLSAAGNYLQGVSNLTHGYKLGGRNSSNTKVSTVERIDYANDTATAVARGPLSSVRYRGGATGNNDFGYYAGGTNPGTESTVDRIDYSNDSATAVVKGPLNAAKYLLAATGNANFGYFGGGNPSSHKSKVERIDYANDTATASPKGNLSLGRRKLAAVGTADFGYFASGTTPGNTVIDRVDYANDTATAVAAGPTAVQTSNAGSASSVTHGYFGAGSPGPLSTVQRIDYANDTATASPKGPLTSAKSTTAGMSSKDGGLPKTQIGTVIYPKGTYATPKTGYFGGGAPSPFSTVDRIDYTNDTATASPKGPLSNGRNQLAATGNQSFGYFGGGESPSGRVSTVDRIDYLNDTAVASPKGPLSAARSGITATGNTNFGYVGGGWPGPVSTVDRIDYSNDAVAASPKGPLSRTRRYFAATGNASFGYFGGGFDPSAFSTVDRIDYSSDTATAVEKGPLSLARYHIAAAGNADFGYFGGGKTPSSPALSTVDRIDYTNDTATASPKGPLSSARAYIAATGTTNFGYFGGGSVVATVDRIDYSNDTATASPKGSLSLARKELGATSARANGFVPIGPSVVANSPVQVEGEEEGGGGGSSSSIFSKLVSLVTTLSNATVATGSNLQNIQSLIESADSSFNVFAVVGNDDYAESLSGTGVAGGKRTHTAKGFNYNSSSSNIISTGSEIVDMSGGSSSGISGGSVIDGKKWMAMAQFDGTNFDGILLWIFTGDSVNNSGTVTSGGRTVTNTRDIFYPVGTGSNNYHHIYPIAIAADGTIYSNVNSGKTGWNFSNGSNAQSSTGYTSNGSMSGDDGVWAFVIQTGAGSFYADGNSPGVNPLTTSYPSFGMGNYNSGDSSNDTYWNGTNTSSSNNVGFVFTGDA